MLDTTPARSSDPRARTDPIPTRHHGEIVFLSYLDGHPFEVVACEGGHTQDFAFTWCRRDDCLFLEEGGCSLGAKGSQIRPAAFSVTNPPVAEFWMADGWTLGDHEGSTVSPESLGYARISAPLDPDDPFECAREEGTTYCRICDDSLPGDDLCVHLFWSDHGGLDGPGSDAADDNDWSRFKEGTLALVREVGCARSLARMLRQGEPMDVFTYDGMISVHYRVKIAGRDFSHQFNGLIGRSDIEDPANWIRSLGKDTPEASRQTLEWLDEEIARQDARRRSGEAAYVVRELGCRTGHERVPFEEARRRAQALRREGRTATIVHLLPPPVYRAEVHRPDGDTVVFGLTGPVRTRRRDYRMALEHPEFGVVCRGWNSEDLLQELASEIAGRAHCPVLIRRSDG
jgi:hypothetical protein